MKHSIFLAGLVAGGALTIAGFAQAADTAMTARADMAHAQQVRAQMQALANRAKAGAMESGVAGAKPGGPTTSELYANPDRAYPPSCLANGMPFGNYSADPNAVHQVVNLIEYDAADGYYDLTEADTITVWRVPCSGGVSATLLEIDRPSASNGNPNQYPIFPNVFITQGSNNSSNCPASCTYPRLPQDPNTLFSDTVITGPLINSTIYVLENYSQNASASTLQIDYNQAFALNIDTLSGSAPAVINVPAYNAASFNNYPSASNPMEITGYMTGNWHDSSHGGQGIQVEVGELSNSGNGTYPRYITIAWYTFDSNGIPYWLFGSGTFNAGATSATVQLAYSSGGGFAGDSGSSATAKLWGTFNVQFPDCNTMQFNYQSTSDLPTGVPTGSGTKTWQRLTQMNGLTCQ